MCKSLDIYHSSSFTFISSYLYSYIHYMACGSRDNAPASSGDASVLVGVRVLSLVQNADRPPPLK